jgi:23S rRNA pseudouridine1911/1915/1917 synthase
VSDELDIVYEDDCLLVVNKPAGVIVHPTYKNPHGTILDALQWRARDWPDGHRPSIVGRLDKQTSGLVPVAKTTPVHAELQRRLSSDDSEKSYLAVVYGRVTEMSGEIDLPLARDPGDRRRVVVSADGARSVTRFERVAVADAAGAGLALLRCRLVTGRTHQIRVHLAAKGWPIVGDAIYGEPRWSQIADPELARALEAFPRQALHAQRLAFSHPATNQRMEIDATIPADIEELLTKTGLGVHA